MLLFTEIIVLFSLASVNGYTNYRSDAESQRWVGKWTNGDWSSLFVYCNSGEYASGFKLFFDNQGGDDEGAVSVTLKCTDPKYNHGNYEEIKSNNWDEGLNSNYHGVWDEVDCPSGETIKGFQSIDGYSSSYGMINIQAICTDGNFIRPHDDVWNTYYSDSYYFYGNMQTCPSNYAVCGYKQQIDTEYWSDWSGVNQLSFKCCPLSTATRSIATETIARSRTEIIARLTTTKSPTMEPTKEPEIEIL